MTPRVADTRLGADVRRIEADLDAFAKLTEPNSGPGVTRLAYTTLERHAHQHFTEVMRNLGLRVRTDAAGNTIAELPGTDPDAPAIGTGSHLDSVPMGGRFDGVAGVVAAMEVARLYVEREVQHTHPMRFVVFAAEEGARFGQAMTGSRIIAGLTGPDDLHDLHDGNRITLADAMRGVGIDPARVSEARWDPADWAGFVELHVEQGGVLEAAAIPIGVVDTISGSTRMALRLTGRASHSGATPMHLRTDALAAAAEVVLQVESIPQHTGQRGARATVGAMSVRPGSITTIPGDVELFVDVRDVDGDRQRQVAAEIVRQALAICQRRGVELHTERMADASPVVLPAWLRDSVADSCARLGVDFRVLPSGASHDSQMINKVVPTGMIFVPSRDGISHAPQEWTSPTDLALGTDVLAESLLAVDRTPHGGMEYSS